MEKNYFNHSIFTRLTFLWAFVESGLGGLMHLFHIPFTGFLIGGFSILINILLAFYTKSNSKLILTGLGLVLLTKFTLSPQSPIGAYVAVSFQGFMGLLIFKVLNVNKFSTILYSTLVMLESAIQKPLMAFIIFGKELGEGIYKTVNNFTNNSTYTDKFMIGFVFIYFLIYIIWGVFIGIWGFNFIQILKTYNLPKDFKFINFKNTKSQSKKYSKIWNLLFVGLVFFFIFILNLKNNIYILKTISILILFGFILPFLFKFILKYFQSKNTNKIQQLISEFPKIKNNILNAYYFTKELNFISRWKEFVFLSIYLNVFYNEHE